MKDTWNRIQITLTATGAFFGWFLGGMDGFLYVLIAFVVIDYITGVLCAIIDKNLCSKIGAKGIFKKVLIFVLVGMGHLLDTYILGFSDNQDVSVLRTAVIFFYLSNEGISILENATHIGLPIPEKLKNVLKQLHDRDGNGSSSSEGKS